MGLTRSEAFAILELPFGAGQDEIRSSYKRLALRWHPDKHNNSEEATKKFQEVSSAYKRLTSEDSDDVNLTASDMFDLFAHIFFHRNGVFTCYNSAVYDSDDSYCSDDDDDDDELDDEILHSIARSFRKKYERKPTEKAAQPAHNLSEAEAMKNAKELIEEEERDRKKAEKRRAKKKRNKERKKEKEREKKEKDEKENIQQKNSKKENIPAGSNTTAKDVDKKKNMTTSSKTVNNNTKLSSGLKEHCVNSTNLKQSGKPEHHTSKRHEDDEVSGGEEPSWDTSSAFFARAAGRNPPSAPVSNPTAAKTNTPVTNIPSSQTVKNGTSQPQATEQIDPVVLRSRQVAVKGNEMANIGNYQAAVDLFTEAISLDAKDFRFFGNRSYCFDRMNQYEKALQDADDAISLAPDWPKGYFRRGRALAGLKLYSDAESSFAQVLKLDKHCEDAMFELARVRVQQLEEMGFPQNQSEAAIQAFGTVQAALEALLAGKVNFPVSAEIYVSDGEDEQKQQVRHNENTSNGDSACRSLWVGNVNPEEVSERHLLQLFSRCGRVDTVRILPKRFCAFVNYDKAESAAIALEKLQGHELGGEAILLRYPNNTGSPGSQAVHPSTNPVAPVKKKQLDGDFRSAAQKLSGPVNGDECYFWRTTGCYFADKCRFRHVQENKGVDLKRVEAKYGGKLRVTPPQNEDDI